MKTKLIWNGVDSVVLLEEALSDPDCDIQGETLYRGTQQHEAYEAVEISELEIPLDEDGEPIFNDPDFGVVDIVNTMEQGAPVTKYFKSPH